MLLDSKLHVLVDCLSDIVDAFDSFASTDCALCNVVAEVQGSEVVPVLFPKAPVCEKTTAL